MHDVGRRDPQRPGGRRRVPVEHVRDGFPTDHHRRKRNDPGDAEPGHRLGPRVAVGMIGIGRLLGDAQREEHDRRAERIADRIHRIGDQRERLADDAAHELHRAERQIDRQPGRGGAARRAVHGLHRIRFVRSFRAPCCCRHCCSHGSRVSFLRGLASGSK